MDISASPSRIKAGFESILSTLRAFLRVLLREFREDGLKYRAMSLVYTSLLSLAPVLAVSFSILKAFGMHNQAQPLLLEVLAPLGEKAAELTSNVIGFVENLQVGVLGFVGFLMLFYTVVSLLEQVEDCFNHIWRVTKPRSLYRRFSDYLSTVLIGPVLLFSGLGIAASMADMDIVRRLIAREPFGTAYYLAGVLLPYVLIIAAFAFTYAFIPNTRVRLGAALAGGLCAGLAWKATGSLFALFMANSAKYSAVYSGFAVILLSMIWLYISWLILLFGGVIAFHVQYPRYLGYATRRPHLSYQCQEKLALSLMYLIGGRHARGKPAYPLRDLADAVNLPWEAVAELLERLVQGGFLVTLGEGTRAYVPARDTDAILLRDIVQTVRATGDQWTLTVRDDALSVIPNLVDALEGSLAAALKDQSLRDLIAEEEPTRTSECQLND